MAPIPKFPCCDCGMNTIPLEGGREYYELHDELWQSMDLPGEGQSDNGTGGCFLCIGCVETRLGRLLVRGDFKALPANNPSPWYSDRLNSRLFLHNRDKALWPQWHPKALTDAVHSQEGYSTYLDYAGALTSARYQPLPDAIMDTPDGKFVINGESWQQEKRSSAETQSKA